MEINNLIKELTEIRDREGNIEVEFCMEKHNGHGSFTISYYNSVRID